MTEKGRIAEAAYSQNSEENPELACTSKPTPSMIVYTDLYPLEIEFNDFFLEDPEYIVGSMTHSRDLLYSPQMAMIPFDCDLEATRRFVPR